MANHKSAQKRARQTVCKEVRNRVKKSESKSIVKAVRDSIASKAKDKALELLPKAQMILDRLTKTGAIKKGNASRRISRLASQIAKL